jgi:tRNA (guanine26-N2/guanine27-N2)-dimethyltransferase
MQTEGKAEFDLGTSFYRPDSQLARELGLLAGQVYRQQQGQLQVLDGMTGSGVRALRYVLEAGADSVWANDADPSVGEILTANLARQLAPDQYRISHQDVRRLLQQCYHDQNYYDLVDLDSFGNPAPLLQAAIGATKIGGLLYLTSTDGRSTAGQAPQAGLRLYGAYGRSHPAHHEQGLRILIGAAVQQAGSVGLNLSPVFSFFRGQIYRVMLRLSRQAWLPEHSGFLGYCHTCGEYEVVPWPRLHRPTHPAQYPDHQAILTGPLWLGPLHDLAWLQAMQTQATQLGWQKPSQLLSTLQAEATLPPYFYTMGEIGRRGRLDLPNRQTLIHALQAQGEAAAATHINPAAIKTTASLATCIQIATQFNPVLAAAPSTQPCPP